MAPKTSPLPAFLTRTQRVGLGRLAHYADVDVNRLSPEVLEYVFAYGLKQVLNDAAASGRSEDEKVGLFNKRLERLYAGELRRASAGEPRDAVSAEVAALARGIVKMKTSYKAGTDEFRAAITKVIEARGEALRTLAEQNIAARRAEADFEIEL